MHNIVVRLLVASKNGLLHLIQATRQRARERRARLQRATNTETQQTRLSDPLAPSNPSLFFSFRKFPRPRGCHPTIASRGAHFAAVSLLAPLSRALIGPKAHAANECSITTGNTYSIKNIGSGTARVFFAQARELHVEEAE